MLFTCPSDYSAPLVVKDSPKEEYEECSMCPCGCVTDSERSVCMEPICNGYQDRTLCAKCSAKNTYCNEYGVILHPLRQTPVVMCFCGKNMEHWLCFQRSRFPIRGLAPDAEQLSLAKTPAERRKLLLNNLNPKEHMSHWPTAQKIKPLWLKILWL